MTKHIKNSIENIFEKQFVNCWQALLLKNWNSIIGNLKDKVQIEKINNDTIILLVSEACWMQELYLLSNLIINKMNSYLDQPRIKHIRFKQAKLKFISVKQKIKIEKNELQKKPLSSYELIALKKIKDPQLCEALTQFLWKCNGQ